MQSTTARPLVEYWHWPPSQASANFTVRWSGDDIGSGIQDFTVFVSQNGGPFEPFVTNTAATSATFTGERGKAYGFFSVARDLVGNVESKLSSAEVSTQVAAAVVAGDVNGDGVVNCADLAIVKAAFGKRLGQPGYDARADVNHDGVVNVVDLATVARQLPAGTTCP